ncbi:MAG: metallopeptidase family protein, partial [Candidatus Peregrinibacteria bacterium]
MEIEDQKFDELVNEVWLNVPQEFKEKIENVGVVVVSAPTARELASVKARGLLLGLFEGVPKTAWGGGSNPCKITIFRQPIMTVSKDLHDLKITIHVVLMHELAHYFGYNDDQMFVLDKKMRARLIKGDKA